MTLEQTSFSAPWVHRLAASDSCWAIILAAGDGKRVGKLIAASGAGQVPKQFWAPDGGETMLEWALQRAARLVPPERTVVVVAAQHQRYWRPLLSPRLPPQNVVVQPANRGTAAGILLPAWRIFAQDPGANVLVLPSDHFVAREDLLHEALEQARIEVGRSPREIVLLGMAMEQAAPGFGWLTHDRPAASGLCRVRHFVEKPEPAVAERLLATGALANSFMLAAHLATLFRLMEQTVPDLLAPFTALHDGGWPPSPGRLAELYESIPSYDFSHHVLAPAVESLRVLPVPECGWSDLGDPARVRRFRRRSRRSSGSVAGVAQLSHSRPAAVAT